MNYELAKKLEDAGFPREGYGTLGTKSQNYVYFPTLEELIEACGDEFYDLTRVTHGEYWVAMADIRHKDYEEVRSWFGKGKTPSEAVANLYLALHAPK